MNGYRQRRTTRSTAEGYFRHEPAGSQTAALLWLAAVVVPAFRNEGYLVRFSIGGEGQVVVATLAGGLIDGQHGEPGLVRHLQGQLHMALADGQTSALNNIVKPESFPAQQDA